MPSPIAHIYYGNLFLKRHPVADASAFLRGTIFPDIRFVIEIERSKTHRLGVKLDDVHNETDSWRAGWLFHNWLDEVWPRYFLQFGLDPLDHKSDSMYRALKFFEDDQLHSRVRGDAFDSLAAKLIGDDEAVSLFGVSVSDAKNWNMLVGELLKSHDSLKAREHLLKRMNISKGEIRALEASDIELRGEGVWQERMRECRKIVSSRF